MKATELALRDEKKALKRAEKEKARVELVKNSAMNQDDEMAKLMGFGGFGTSKK